MEFARDKGTLFDKWCTANKVTDFNLLWELMLLEEFKNCLPEKVVVYLNEQKVTLMSYAAVLADEFILTHKNVFLPTRSENLQPIVDVPGVHFVRSKVNSPRAKEDRECFYCHKRGHIVVDCSLLKRKQQLPSKSVGFVKALKTTAVVCSGDEVEETYRPFILKGLISFFGKC